MKRSFLLTSVVLSFGAGLVGAGCQDSFKSCENTATCPPEGDGDGDGDTGGGGGDGDGDGDTGGTGDGDVGGQGGAMGTGGDPDHPCKNCGGSTPHCSTELQCVGCRNDDDCTTDELPYCDVDGEDVCVGCLEDGDCTADPTKPLCDADTKSCVACSDDTSCGDKGNRCLGTGECVECTPQTDDRAADDDDCGTNVCNPETFECEADLTQADKDVCESCIADSECAVDHNCVRMDFAGEERLGGYCLKDSNVEGCSTNPYRSLTGMRVSLSGAAAVRYCSINEELTTCEAVLDLANDETCVMASDCGAEDLDDGLCETVTAAAGRCTYACTALAQCMPADPGTGCGGNAQDDAGTYCGGM